MTIPEQNRDPENPQYGHELDSHNTKPELASKNEVRALNIAARALVETYGRKAFPLAYTRMREAAFELVDNADWDELRIRITPSQNANEDDLIHIEYWQQMAENAVHEVRRRVMVETEGDNPLAVDASTGIAELKLEPARRADARLALEHVFATDEYDEKIDIFAARFDSRKDETVGIAYGAELHAQTMAVLGSAKRAYLPSGGTTET